MANGVGWGVGGGARGGWDGRNNEVVIINASQAPPQAPGLEVGGKLYYDAVSHTNGVGFRRRLEPTGLFLFFFF